MSPRHPQEASSSRVYPSLWKKEDWMGYWFLESCLLPYQAQHVGQDEQ